MLIEPETASLRPCLPQYHIHAGCALVVWNRGAFFSPWGWPPDHLKEGDLMWVVWVLIC